MTEDLSVENSYIDVTKNLSSSPIEPLIRPALERAKEEDSQHEIVTAFIEYIQATRDCERDARRYDMLAVIMGSLAGIITVGILILANVPFIYTSLPMVIIGMIATFIIKENRSHFILDKYKQNLYNRHMRAHNLEFAVNDYLMDANIHDLSPKFTMDKWIHQRTDKPKQYFWSSSDKPPTLSNIIIAYEGKTTVENINYFIKLWIDVTTGINIHMIRTLEKQRHVTIEHL